MLESLDSNLGAWMKLGEAAHALGISEITLRRKVKTGKIVHDMRDGKYYVYIPASEKQEYITKPAFNVTNTLSNDFFSKDNKLTHLGTNNFKKDISGINKTELIPEKLELKKYEDIIFQLNLKLAEKNEQIKKLRYSIEDQQILIAFLEDTIKDLSK